jgi:hypothetical protein
MDMARKQTRTVRLELTPLNLKSKLKYRVTALIGDAPLHMGTFDLGNERALASFLRKVEDKAKQQRVKVDIATLEVELLQHAHDASLGLTDNGDSAAGRDRIDHTKVLEAFGITVLGEHDDQAIRGWSEHTQKIFVIKSPANWKDAEVLQCVGQKVADVLWLVPDGDVPEGKYTLRDVQRAFALAAAEAPRISTSKLIGQGIWPHGKRYLIVDGAKALLYDGTTFRRLLKPTIDKKIIELDVAKQWHGSMVPAVRAIDANKARERLDRLVGFLDSWNWTHCWDARVVAALVFATFIQAVWRWRPLVSITGPSDCGKTTLFQELLLGLFLDWAIFTDRSTEAGLRQAIAHSSTPVMIDEFDKYQHRQRVLELFRTSSRAGKVLRGTADQTGQQFSLNHIPWFAAIESGDIWGQDRNRFIHIELEAPAGRALTLPATSELAELGRQLAAAAIWAGHRSVQLADTIKDSRIEGVHGRLIESFSVPAAMYAVLQHGHQATEAQARRLLEQMIEGRQQLEVQGEPDELQLLRDILAANMRVTAKQGVDTVSKDLSVGQLLQNYDRFRSDLEAKGLRIIRPRESAGQMLFIAPEPVARFLLKGTRWEGSRIDQILLRLDGAQRTQQRCGGARRPGVAVPWPQCHGGL